MVGALESSTAVRREVLVDACRHGLHCIDYIFFISDILASGTWLIRERLSSQS